MRLLLLLILLTGCTQYGYDYGLGANIQTRDEYNLYLGQHKCYDPYRNWPYTFDPEDGGWEIR